MAFIDELGKDNTKVIFIRLKYLDTDLAEKQIFFADHDIDVPDDLVSGNLIKPEPRLGKIPNFNRLVNILNNKIIEKGSYTFNIDNQDAELTAFFQNNYFKNTKLDVFLTIKELAAFDYIQLSQGTIKELKIDSKVQLKVDEITTYQKNLKLDLYNYNNQPEDLKDKVKPVISGIINGHQVGNINAINSDNFIDSGILVKNLGEEQPVDFPRITTLRCLTEEDANKLREIIKYDDVVKLEKVTGQENDPELVLIPSDEPIGPGVTTDNLKFYFRGATAIDPSGPDLKLYIANDQNYHYNNKFLISTNQDSYRESTTLFQNVTVGNSTFTINADWSFLEEDDLIYIQDNTNSWDVEELRVLSCDSVGNVVLKTDFISKERDKDDVTVYFDKVRSININDKTFKRERVKNYLRTGDYDDITTGYTEPTVTFNNITYTLDPTKTDLVADKSKWVIEYAYRDFLGFDYSGIPPYEALFAQPEGFIERVREPSNDGYILNTIKIYINQGGTTNDDIIGFLDAYAISDPTLVPFTYSLSAGHGLDTPDCGKTLKFIGSFNVSYFTQYVTDANGDAKSLVVVLNKDNTQDQTYLQKYFEFDIFTSITIQPFHVGALMDGVIANRINTLSGSNLPLIAVADSFNGGVIFKHQTYTSSYAEATIYNYVGQGSEESLRSFYFTNYTQTYNPWDYEQNGTEWYINLNKKDLALTGSDPIDKYSPSNSCLIYVGGTGSENRRLRYFPDEDFNDRNKWESKVDSFQVMLIRNQFVKWNGLNGGSYIIDKIDEDDAYIYVTRDFSNSSEGLGVQIFEEFEISEDTEVYINYRDNKQHFSDLITSVFNLYGITNYNNQDLIDLKTNHPNFLTNIIVNENKEIFKYLQDYLVSFNLISFLDKFGDIRFKLYNPYETTTNSLSFYNLIDIQYEITELQYTDVIYKILKNSKDNTFTDVDKTDPFVTEYKAVTDLEVKEEFETKIEKNFLNDIFSGSLTYSDVFTRKYFRKTKQLKVFGNLDLLQYDIGTLLTIEDFDEVSNKEVYIITGIETNGINTKLTLFTVLPKALFNLVDENGNEIVDEVTPDPNNISG